jgi:hypothetical protein
MCGRELVDPLNGVALADHPLVSHNVCRATPALQQGHFTECEARSDAGDPFPAFSGNRNEDAHGSAGNDVKECRLNAFADDYVTLLEVKGLNVGFEQPEFIGTQTLEDIQLREGKLRPVGNIGLFGQ